uniref:Filamentous haemagglutinin FhaB/tRNA nuclease CdiA-like TPS domain-containing protein n=1 Tax=Tolypothrix bouteillei VB521301 TaxID=1479485 RepID=A0A0C1RHX9_9CYAN
MNVADTVSLRDQGRISTFSLNKITESGEIAISARALDLRNGASISTASFGQGNSGNIQIQTRSLSLLNGAGIQALARGQGNSGNLTITASDSIEVVGEDSEPFVTANGSFPSTSDISTSNYGSGNGGQLTINTGRLTVGDGGTISTGIGSNSSGRGGDLVINAADSVEVFGETRDGQYSSFLAANTNGFGNAGNIEINTRRLSVRDGAIITTFTVQPNSTGRAGDITINAQDSVEISGRDRSQGRSNLNSFTLNNGNAGRIIVNAGSLSLRDGGRLSATTSGQGNAGHIGITTGNLFISNGGQVIVNTNGWGDAGDITITARDGVSLDGVDRFGISSGINASTLEGARGNGGRITIDTNSLQITNGAIIGARTLNANPGGNVTINANTVDAINGGQIFTSTFNSGQAGNIILNANRVNLSGIDPTYAQRGEQFGSSFVPNQGAASGLYANTTSDASGIGGTIRVNTTELNLFDRAQISSSSLGTGNAGDITINALQSLRANNSDITTNAAKSSGGEIKISAPYVCLRGDSDIRTDVASGQNQGGNITITADSIIAFDDSDILAFARDGRGGNITLNTRAFFASGYQATQRVANLDSLDGNNRVDVNATGAISSGNIVFPDVSFIQNSLIELVQNPIDTNALIANSCIARSDKFKGSFVITGADSLPYRPGDAVISSYPTGDVRNVQDNRASLSWQKGDPIVEPLGIYQLPDGRFVLSRECS